MLNGRKGIPGIEWGPGWRGLSAAGAALLLLLSGVDAAGALTITFDETPGTAPAAFADVVPGGAFGPALALPGAAVDGGVIALAITPSDQAATSLPNLYATSDFLPLGDGSLLEGTISVALAAPAGSISLDVGNGNAFEAAFTLTAYASGSPIASSAVTLAPFASPGGFTGTLSVAGPGITDFTVTSDQPAGSKLFMVDTIVASVPEPSTGLLLVLSLAGSAVLRRLPDQGPSRNARPQSALARSSSYAP